MPSYIDLKKEVDTVYGTKCHDCDQPATTYYVDPDNPEKKTKRGRLGYEFYAMVIRQGFPSTVLPVCPRHYKNRHQNDLRNRSATLLEG